MAKASRRNFSVLLGQVLSKTRVVNADQLNSLIEIQNREWAFVLLTLIPVLMFIALWLAGRIASIWVLLAAAVWIAFNHYIHRRLRAKAGAILSTTPLSHDKLVFPNVSIDLIAAGLARSVPPYLRNFCLIMSILFAGSSAVTLVDGMAHLTLGAQEMTRSSALADWRSLACCPIFFVVPESYAFDLHHRH
ncbi:hypothetical protein [Mesorhizobium sp. BHbdii]